MGDLRGDTDFVLHGDGETVFQLELSPKPN